VNLKILLPSEVLIDQEVIKIVAEGQNGSFGLLPRHACFVSALIPGILYFKTDEENEEYIAVDQGILVKYGDRVLVSVRNAVRGPRLSQLKQTIQEHFQVLGEKEKRARSAAAKIEAGIIRRFLEISRYG
jgi:F-type H+-transporting ATPase subunit epsilon